MFRFASHPLDGWFQAAEGQVTCSHRQAQHVTRRGAVVFPWRLIECLAFAITKLAYTQPRPSINIQPPFTTTTEIYPTARHLFIQNSHNLSS